MSMPPTCENKMINQHFSQIPGNNSNPLSLDKARLGILGGSGIYSIDSIEDIKELTIETPFGEPSDTLRLGKLGGMEVVFLARHGRHHTFSPTDIPYRANIWALRSLNVRWILSPSAVGSLQEQIRPLDIVIPNQFIDRTHQRPITFFSGGIVAHVTMADPFCTTLSKIVEEEGERIMPEGRQIHRGGTYLAMEGPAFSTRAESELYRSWGCSVIGMTNHTEARLAREAEIAYSSISMATDYDCWHPNHEEVSVGMVIDNLKANSIIGGKIVEAVAKTISKSRPQSSAHFALKDGLMTPKELVPDHTRHKLNIFTNPYWGEIENI